jgi:hypothetical protein
MHGLSSRKRTVWAEPKEVIDFIEEHYCMFAENNSEKFSNSNWFETMRMQMGCDGRKKILLKHPTSRSTYRLMDPIVEVNGHVYRNPTLDGYIRRKNTQKLKKKNKKEVIPETPSDEEMADLLVQLSANVN